MYGARFHSLSMVEIELHGRLHATNIEDELPPPARITIDHPEADDWQAMLDLDSLAPSIGCESPRWARTCAHHEPPKPPGPSRIEQKREARRLFDLHVAKYRAEDEPCPTRAERARAWINGHSVPVAAPDDYEADDEPNPRDKAGDWVACAWQPTPRPPRGFLASAHYPRPPGMVEPPPKSFPPTGPPPPPPRAPPPPPTEEELEFQREHRRMLANAQRLLRSQFDSATRALRAAGMTDEQLDALARDMGLDQDER